MSIRLRFLLLLLALGSTLFAGIALWYREDQKQVERLLRSAHRNQGSLIDKVADLYEKDLQTFVSDYSLWTELGDYIARPKPGWADGNVDAGLVSFKSDAVWLFDPKGKLVHFASAAQRADLRTALGQALSLPVLSKPGGASRQFFVRAGDRVVEIRVAKVADSNDRGRRRAARGYMVAARVWTPDHYAALGNILGSTVEMRPPSPANLAEPADRTPEHRRVLRSPTGRPVAVLRFAFPNSDKVDLQEETRGEATRIVLGALALLGLFSAFTLAWVSKPLRMIVESLAEGKPEPVQALAGHRDEFGQVGRLVLASFDLKRELKTREEQKAAVLESAIDAVVTMDAEGLIVEFNLAAERMFGVLRSAAIGRNLGEVIIPERYRAMHNEGVLRHRGPLSKRAEVSALRCDGTEFPVEISLICVPHGDTRTYTGFIRDLSEQRRLEEQLRNAQKMESIGILASGVAHEINTPMQYVLDSTKFLTEGSAALSELLLEYRGLRSAVADEPRYKDISARLEEREERLDAAFLLEEMPLAAAESLRGIDRVRKIVRAMRQMAHPGEEAMRPAALNGVIDDAMALVRNEARGVADLDLRLQPGLPDVFCNSGEVGQVVVVLAVNAVHAIASSTQGTKRGKIVVETRMAGEFVEIAVSDDGPGIPDAIRHRVFDPFFTTKPVGKGTGQGLSIAFSIVKRHGGKIDFSNNRGGGATFVVSLPVAQAVAA